MKRLVSSARSVRAERVFAGALIVALAMPLAAPTRWVPAAAAQDSLEAEKRRELERIQSEVREKREAATRLKGQENKALGQLRRTERDLNLTRQRLRGLQRRHRLFDDRLSNTRHDLERNVSMLRQQRTKLARRLRNL